MEHQEDVEVADHDAAPGEGGELAVGGAHHHVVVVLQTGLNNTHNLTNKSRDDSIIKFQPEDEKAGADDHAHPRHCQSKGRPENYISNYFL